MEDRDSQLRESESEREQLERQLLELRFQNAELQALSFEHDDAKHKVESLQSQIDEKVREIHSHDDVTCSRNYTINRGLFVESLGKISDKRKRGAATFIGRNASSVERKRNHTTGSEAPARTDGSRTGSKAQDADNGGAVARQSVTVVATVQGARRTHPETLDDITAVRARQ